MSNIREKLTTIKTFIRDITIFLNKCDNEPGGHTKYIEQLNMLEQYATAFNEHKKTNNNDDIKQIESQMILPENNAKIQSMLSTVYNTLHKRSIITICYNISQTEYYRNE